MLYMYLVTLIANLQYKWPLIDTHDLHTFGDLLTRGETLRSELDSSLQWEKYTEENSDQLFLIVMGIIIFCKYILFSTKTLGTECMHWLVVSTENSPQLMLLKRQAYPLRLGLYISLFLSPNDIGTEKT
jgi:hypothetical protein